MVITQLLNIDMQTLTANGKHVLKNSGLMFLFQGVVEFSLCLLFAKLVSYTFLYWLPLYISNVGQ